MTAPQESDGIVDVEISAVAHGGDGVGRINALTCFVPGALPGETVRARIFRRAKNAVWARTLEVISPSPHRLSNAFCSGRSCAAACAWHDFAYPAQGEWKTRIVAESMRRIGGVAAEVVFIEEPALRLGYRTRAVFHGDGACLGYFAPRTHDVIPLPQCPLNHPRLNTALEALRPMGLRGNIHVTVNPEGDEILARLRRVTPAVKAAFPLANAFDSAECSRFIFDGAPIVNGAFSQASLLLNRMLRREVDIRVGETETLLDLYCGNGNLSLHHAPNCRVVGVDNAKAAIAAANQIVPGAYRIGNERVMAALIQEQSWDVILLDPPRTGAKALAAPLAEAKAGRIVYVSCNPATFARDARSLMEGGWRLTSAAAIDMFPHTPHVETIGVFVRT
ncbi:MAG TPA: class I SAM-dependent RNA methyltransferase [Candidatus Hydrogenedentes bacterium]|nr:class I SAM-dependent RNA methyltransferase [Candidatus Hydrogenedentota bacterium]